ncbi:putative agmatine deiminase [Rosa chinensis]|uniref:Putative agmatine deiminase n=1 Tax=Rosa chinensis TaxID=74649 RepID=A0A2P6QUI7_ROSCH|nr:putative agmatine deiminase [Rosa chinensis]
MMIVIQTGIMTSLWHGRICALCSDTLPKGFSDTCNLQILAIEKLPRFPHTIILEGGSIHVDGEGNNQGTMKARSVQAQLSSYFVNHKLLSSFRDLPHY